LAAAGTPIDMLALCLRTRHPAFGVMGHDYLIEKEKYRYD